MESKKLLEIERKTDLFYVKSLILIGALVANSFPDSSINCYHLALNTNIKNENQEAYTSILNNLGNSYQSLGEFEWALEYSKDALMQRILVADSISIAKSYGNVGNIYRSLGELDSAIVNLHSALNILVFINDSAQIANIYHYLGIVHMDLEQFPEVRSNEFKSLVYNQSNSAIEIGSLLAIGSSFMYEKKYDSVMTYFQGAIRLAESTNNLEAESIILSNIGTFYRNQNKLDSAFLYYSKSYSINAEVGYKSGEYSCLLNIANVYREKGDYELSLGILNDSIIPNLQFVNYIDHPQIYSEIAMNLVQLNEFEQANFAYEEFIRMQDSIFNIKKNQETNRLLLSKERELSEIKEKLLNGELISAEQNNDQLIHVNRLLYIMLGSFIVLICFIIYLYILIRKRNRVLIEDNRVFEILKEIIDINLKSLFNSSDANDTFEIGDILYVHYETQSKRCMIFLNNQQKIIYTQSLNSISRELNSLSPFAFEILNRVCLVNLQYVTKDEKSKRFEVQRSALDEIVPNFRDNGFIKNETILSPEKGELLNTFERSFNRYNQIVSKVNPKTN